MYKAIANLRDRKDSGFSLVELLIVVAIVAVLAAIAIPIYTNQKNKAYRSIAVQDGRALSQEVSSVLSDYRDYGSTSGTIAVSGGTLTVTMGTIPTPSTPTAPTSTVKTSTGSTVSGNLPTAAQSAPKFCLKVTNTSQDAVYDETGYRAGMTTCTAGVAS